MRAFLSRARRKRFARFIHAPVQPARKQPSEDPADRSHTVSPPVRPPASRANLRCNDQVNVCRAAAHGLPTDSSRASGSAPVRPIALFRDGCHLSHTALGPCAGVLVLLAEIRLQQPASKVPVIAIDRSRFVTMQMAPVAGEGDEIVHRRDRAIFQPLPAVAAPSESITFMSHTPCDGNA
jgi:hypothetical protein